MREQGLNDVVARKFLLGQLSPEEQGRIEELAFDDTETFTFLESVEDDLIDDFIQGELSADERQRFETHFLSQPGRQENLKVSRLLRRDFDETDIEEAPQTELKENPRDTFFDWLKSHRLWVRVPLAAAFLILLLVAVWLYLRARVNQQPVPIQAGNDKPVVVPTPVLTASPSPEPTGKPVYPENKPKPSPRGKPQHQPAFATLLPGLNRSEGPRQLSFPAGTTSVPIDLLLPAKGSYKTYEVRLETEGGRVLQSWPNLTKSETKLGKFLRIELPIDQLQLENFYRIVVSGIAVNGKVTNVSQYGFEPVN